LATLRGQVVEIILGTVFVFVGLAICGIAAMRRRSGVRILVWLGIWSATYGMLRLVDPLAALTRLPHWFQASAPYVDAVILYLTVVVASLYWLELSVGKLRLFLWIMIFAGLAIGVAGFIFFLFTGVNNKLMPYNNFLAACLLLVLIAVVAVPRLAHKFLLTPDSGVLLVGTLIFGVEALSANALGTWGGRRYFSTIWDSLAFAVYLFSLGYVALQMVFASERRLLTIERELAVAREIQNWILPSGSPEMKNLRIIAVYRPMTAVAGDFYDFIPVDAHRVGVLVADVSGHGVPAALIAAMIKAAVQSVASRADSPSEVLCGLNRILSGQPHDQFVTAAYLFIDTENRKALYSAAGHPPLLRSRGGKLERIESNGLVFGVTPEPHYPVYEMAISPGDRFLLYTDGIVEPENARGNAFGDSKLEEVVHNTESGPASELVDQLLTEIKLWQSASISQQDDITLVVVDVL
jgi:sigma-B regulation protein RsbU (phosphoserine phosphatase)